MTVKRIVITVGALLGYHRHDWRFTGQTVEGDEFVMHAHCTKCGAPHTAKREPPVSAWRLLLGWWGRQPVVPPPPPERDGYVSNVDYAAAWLEWRTNTILSRQRRKGPPVSLPPH